MSPLPYGEDMRIDRMVDGALYEIKYKVQLDANAYTGPENRYPILRGWRYHRGSSNFASFVYLGWKEENWKYAYLQTNKIHYILWQGDIWVMDNQFAKHIKPVWDGDEDGKPGRN